MPFAVKTPESCTISKYIRIFAPVINVVEDNFEFIHVNYNPRKSGGEAQQQQATALMKRLEWHLLDTLKVPSTYRGMRIIYKYDDGFHDDFNVSDELKTEYYD